MTITDDMYLPLMKSNSVSKRLKADIFGLFSTLAVGELLPWRKMVSRTRSIIQNT